MVRFHRETALYGFLAAIAGLAAGFATAGWTQSFVLLPIDGLIVELTPARVVNYMIENVGEEAHYLHIAGAVAIAGGGYAATATAGLLVARRLDRGLLGAGVAAVLAASASAVIAGTALPSVAAGLAVGAVVTVGATGSTRTEPTPNAVRRRVIGSVGATISFVGLSLPLGRRVTERAREIDEPLPGEESSVDDLLRTASESALDSPAISPPVSPIGEFYTIDINSAPPIVDAADWQLSIRGSVDRDLTLDYDELRDRERVDRFVALRCIGEDLNDDKLDTALWTGTPIDPLLERAEPGGEYVELHSADGYVSTFRLEHLRGGLLAYGMNGRVLPRSHGHPVRAVMPGTWGKLNNKWLTDIVVVEEPTEGYWEERGWQSEAPIQAVAKLWSVERLDDGRIEIGGHAYAGTRGVDRVEVSTDGGDAWTDAELADPLPGDDVTRQWRYRYEAADPHEVVVRTVDGTGTLQPSERTESFPDGASGWVRETIDP